MRLVQAPGNDQYRTDAARLAWVPGLILTSLGSSRSKEHLTETLEV
jgi:hypothetical protein